MSIKENIKMGRDKENYAKWQKDNLRVFALKMNRTNEKDVIEHLEKVPNVRKYIIDLIRKDMK